MTPEPSEPTAPPLLIGWKERLDFPEWGLKSVRVKIDTGACTSALGAVGLRAGGGERAADRPPAASHVPPAAGAHDAGRGAGAAHGSRHQHRRRPRGEADDRGGDPPRSGIQRIRLTITSRDGMRFPMILGREALAGAFIVDVATSAVESIVLGKD